MPAGFRWRSGDHAVQYHLLQLYLLPHVDSPPPPPTTTLLSSMCVGPNLMWKKEAVPLVEFMYLVFTRMPGESYRWQLGSLLSYLYYVFRALINSLVCWFNLTCFWIFADLAGDRTVQHHLLQLYLFSQTDYSPPLIPPLLSGVCRS